MANFFSEICASFGANVVFRILRKKQTNKAKEKSNKKSQQISKDKKKIISSLHIKIRRHNMLGGGHCNTIKYE